jgi:nitric oxide synthase oxygenase domain/subunit
MERNLPMMQFEAISETIAVATNSIKEVRIERDRDMNNYDRNTWMLYTPEGRLLDDFTSAGPFVSFEAAKRNAEMNVGMKMNWGDF